MLFLAEQLGFGISSVEVPWQARDAEQLRVCAHASAAERTRLRRDTGHEGCSTHAVRELPPPQDVAGSKIGPLTPLTMLCDVARVNVCYRTGVWPLPDLKSPWTPARDGVYREEVAPMPRDAPGEG